MSHDRLTIQMLATQRMDCKRKVISKLMRGCQAYLVCAQPGSDVSGEPVPCRKTRHENARGTAPGIYFLGSLAGATVRSASMTTDISRGFMRSATRRFTSTGPPGPSMMKFFPRGTVVATGTGRKRGSISVNGLTGRRNPSGTNLLRQPSPTALTRDS